MGLLNPVDAGLNALRVLPQFIQVSAQLNHLPGECRVFFRIENEWFFAWARDVLTGVMWGSQTLVGGDYPIL